MNEITVKGWILKAENDFKTGKDEMATSDPATDTVCFHMQQCVEKYLKAFLIFSNKEIRKTHDIGELIYMCIEVDPEFKKLFNAEADELTKYAVEIRYPDDLYFPPIEEARESIEITAKAKGFVLEKLVSNGYNG